MGMLRSAVDELRSEDVRSASDEALGEDLCELETVSRVLDAERARRLAEVDRRGSWAVDGHLSVVSWLAARLRVGFGRATRQVKLARALKEMPLTFRAFGAGDISSEAVGLLVQAREAAPEVFRDSEEMLVDAAGALPARELRHALAYWREAADATRAEERARRVYEGRHVHVSPTFDGTVRIDGALDPESGRPSSRRSAQCRTRGPGPRPGMVWRMPGQLLSVEPTRSPISAEPGSIGRTDLRWLVSGRTFW